MFEVHQGPRPEIESRPVRTPAGVTRIVALDARWWECLDWMVEFKGESVEDIADFCLRFLHKFPEDDFTSLFQYYIQCHMESHRRACFGLSNDNEPPEGRREDKNRR